MVQQGKELRCDEELGKVFKKRVYKGDVWSGRAGLRSVLQGGDWRGLRKARWRTVLRSPEWHRKVRFYILKEFLRYGFVKLSHALFGLVGKGVAM